MILKKISEKCRLQNLLPKSNLLKELCVAYFQYNTSSTRSMQLIFLTVSNKLIFLTVSNKKHFYTINNILHINDYRRVTPAEESKSTVIFN